MFQSVLQLWEEKIQINHSVINFCIKIEKSTTVFAKNFDKQRSFDASLKNNFIRLKWITFIFRCFRKSYKLISYLFPLKIFAQQQS